MPKGPPKGTLPKANKQKKQKELPHPSSYSAEDLEQYFSKLFSIADANGDGVLQPDELTQLLGLCGFNLSAEEIAQFVSEADTNHDGVIEYSEFVPVATKMLQATAVQRSGGAMIQQDITEISMQRASKIEELEAIVADRDRRIRSLEVALEQACPLDQHTPGVQRQRVGTAGQSRDGSSVEWLSGATSALFEALERVNIELEELKIENGILKSSNKVVDASPSINAGSQPDGVKASDVLQQAPVRKQRRRRGSVSMEHAPMEQPDSAAGQTSNALSLDDRILQQAQLATNGELEGAK